MTNTATPINADHSPNNICNGAFLIDLAAVDGNPSDEFKAPEVIKVTPSGNVTTRDDRNFTFDADVLVERFRADKTDVPIDLEHSLSSSSSDKSKGAIAWIKKLEARTDGTYAHVEWLAEGLKILKARSHRYISPTFKHDQSGKATWLHSVALVAAPALSKMPALAHAFPTPSKETKTMSFANLASALGLKADASEEAMIDQLNVKLESMVDKKIHDETLSQLTTTTAELTELKASIKQDKVDSYLEKALKDKKILPSQKDHFAKLCTDDAGFENVQKLIDAMPEKLGTSSLDETSLSANDNDQGNIDPVKLAAEAKAYQAEMKGKGVLVTIDQAVTRVHEAKK